MKQYLTWMFRIDVSFSVGATYVVHAISLNTLHIPDNIPPAQRASFSQGSKAGNQAVGQIHVIIYSIKLNRVAAYRGWPLQCAMLSVN